MHVNTKRNVYNSILIKFDMNLIHSYSVRSVDNACCFCRNVAVGEATFSLSSCMIRATYDSQLASSGRACLRMVKYKARRPFTA